MPYTGAVFSRVHNWVNDRADGIKIIASRMDAEFDNFRAGMDQVMLRNGVAPMSGPLSLGTYSIMDIDDLVFTATDVSVLTQNQSIRISSGVSFVNIESGVKGPGMYTNNVYATLAEFTTSVAAPTATFANTVFGAGGYNALVVGSSAILNFAAGDYAQYDRTNDVYHIVVGTISRFQVTAAGVKSDFIGFGARRLNDKLNESTLLGLCDNLNRAVVPGEDFYPLWQSVLPLIDTSGGQACIVEVPGTYFTLSQSIIVPDRVTITGRAELDTIVNPAFNGPAFVFDSVRRAGLRNMRIGFDAFTSTGIQIRTTTGDCFGLNFTEVEIAGKGGGYAGQIGIDTLTSGGRIITECAFDRITLHEVDQPISDNGAEGNFWTRMTIDGFSYSGVFPAYDGSSHATYFQGRVAGTCQVGATAYKQVGSSNNAQIAVDIGNGRQCVDITGKGNHANIQRPYEVGPFVQTPIGNIAQGNTYIDSGHAVFPPVIANFALTDWGNTATVSAVSASSDGKSIQFTVNSSGAGQAIYPTVDFTYPNGSLPRAGGVLSVTRGGGNQGQVSGTFAHNVGLTTATFRWDGTPVAGEAYTFVMEIKP